MRLTLLAALVGLVLTCPAQAGEEFRFGGCQHPIEISRSGSLANLSRAELARVTQAWWTA
jgi:hypothetical protein